MSARRLLARFVFALASAQALVAASACSTFSSGENEAPIDGGGTDGGGTDGGASDGDSRDGSPGDGSPGDARADAGFVNLLSNGDFEIGCGGWTSAGASFERVTPGRGDAGAACRVCASGGPTFIIEQLVRVGVAAGEQYNGEAWLRTDPDGAPPPPLYAEIDLYNGKGPIVQQGAQSAGPGLNATWQQTSALIAVSVDGGTDLQLVFLAATSQGCFLIDDAVLYRAK
jgi:hypothetical protein